MENPTHFGSAWDLFDDVLGLFIVSLPVICFHRGVILTGGIAVAMVIGTAAAVLIRIAVTRLNLVIRLEQGIVNAIRQLLWNIRDLRSRLRNNFIYELIGVTGDNISEILKAS